MATKYTKWTEILPNEHATFVARPSKIYPNCDFWFENKPSGNPAEGRSAGAIKRVHSNLCFEKGAIYNLDGRFLFR
jgi:hypothetical protein